jgi:formylglycine-generating enzyme
MEGMRHLPGGTFKMGSDRFYPEERPRRRVRVGPFWIDETPVTNRDFARFVAATGHKTVAEFPPDPADYPGMLPHLAQPGSVVVFQRTRGPVNLNEPNQWWQFRPGASWRRPLGERSSAKALDDHPVVHVASADAEAYAIWAGQELPTEAEWEYAAKGGLDDAEFAWGDELAPQGKMLANYWQGEFPWANPLLDGFERTSPAGSFDPGSHVRIARKVLKGGSHLCAENYCQRYRPAARSPQMVETSTSHIGFRCIIRG